MRAQHDDLSVRMAHEGIERRKGVVQPPPGHANRQHQRRGQNAEALVEIGAVLFSDSQDAVGGKCRVGRGGQAVEIADHRLGPVSKGQRAVRTAIRGDQNGGVKKRSVHNGFGRLTAAQ